jgi:flagellar protein FlbT
MPLRITLGKGGSVVINGAVITNGGQRATLSIENQADIIRGSDIIQEDDIDTTEKEIYFLIQSAIIHDSKKLLDTEIQKRLALIAGTSGGEKQKRAFQASSHVANGNLFSALRQVKAIL